MNLLYRYRVDRGFTIIELMLVLFVMAIITGAAVLNLDNALPSYRFRATARRIAETIKVARQSAITNSTDYYIIYDFDNKKIWLSNSKNVSAPAQAENKTLLLFELHPDIELSDIITGNNYPQTAGTLAIQATPFGTVQQHIVHLKTTINKEERYYTIIVFPLTGFTRVSNQYEILNLKND